MRTLFVGLLTGLVVATTACSDGDSDESRAGSSSSSVSRSTTSSTAAEAPAPDLDAVRITLTELADLERPTALAARPDDPTLFVTEKAGRVRAIRDGALVAEPVLDISGEVGSTGNEQGLLGLAFSNDGTRLFVDFTNRDGDTRVVEYTVAGGSVDADSARELLAFDQPQPNHNGGSLAIGPDGLLYIGSGDGGGSGDSGTGHADGGNGQSTDTLLGKILRIDPTPAGDRPYTIPAGNPFANGGGRPEIFALGLRNPWRFSFDEATGDLWIGDVGQNEWEEIDFVPAGGGAGDNFGWNRLEGTHEFAGDVPPDTVPSDTVAPIFEYSHAETGGCSVTGGYVYRGRAIPALRGAYVFADYCVGELQGLVQAGGVLTEVQSLDARTASITSFGEDDAGELYVLSDGGGIYRIDPS